MAAGPIQKGWERLVPKFFNEGVAGKARSLPIEFPGTGDEDVPAPLGRHGQAEALAGESGGIDLFGSGSRRRVQHEGNDVRQILGLKSGFKSIGHQRAA